jgi:hypothetical protein
MKAKEAEAAVVVLLVLVGRRRIKRRGSHH